MSIEDVSGARERKLEIARISAQGAFEAIADMATERLAQLDPEAGAGLRAQYERYKAAFEAAKDEYWNGSGSPELRPQSLEER